jgi:hypothetical protein
MTAQPPLKVVGGALMARFVRWHELHSASVGGALSAVGSTMAIVACEFARAVARQGWDAFSGGASQGRHFCLHINCHFD